MSLNRRRIQRPSMTTRCDTEPLSAPAKAKPRSDSTAMGERGPDDPAVGDRHHPLTGMGGGDAVDRVADPTDELVVGLGAGDHVPPLLGEHAHGDRVELGDLLAEDAALPLPQPDLAQAGLDDRLQAEAGGEGRGGLGGAAQRRDVDRVDGLVGEPLADPLGLLEALGRERRVPVPVDQRERPAGAGPARTRRAGRGRSRSSPAAAGTRSGGTRPRRAGPARRSPAGRYRLRIDRPVRPSCPRIDPELISCRPTHQASREDVRWRSS